MNESERVILEHVDRGFFEIDEHGRVWRLKQYHGNQHGTRVKDVERRRAEITDRYGYLQVWLQIEGTKYVTSAHRLVWMNLNGHIPDELQMNHSNGVKDDNRPENLELVTPGENIRHAMRLGLLDNSGENHGGSVLTWPEVNEMRERYAEGETPASLARAFDIDPAHAWNVVNHKMWKSG